MAKKTKTEKTEKISKVSKGTYTFKFNSTGKPVKTIRKEIAEILRKDSRYTEVE